MAKQKATEAILLYVELDVADPVIEELLPLMSHKLPKIVAATLGAFTSIYHAFGCTTVQPKPVLKILPKVYGHADKNVRSEAQNLTVELYRWLREGMKPLFWNDLKPVQQSDLEKLFEKVKDEPAPKPERLLQSQQAAVASAVPAEIDGDAGVEEEEEGEGIDLEPEIMSVDVMAKIPKDLQDQLASTKWKDRKDALDNLHAIVNVPAIETGPFDEIMHALAKCMKDANIAVVTIAANCVEALAKGLRKSFSKYRSIMMGPIIERLKERKQSVTDALGAALDAICAATSLSECLEETLQSLTHKNPLVKLESTRFLSRALKSTREAPSIPEVKSISDATSKLLGDSQPTQRDGAAEVLGVLVKIMGERIMNAHFEGLDDIRKVKIKEFAESAEVRSKYKPKAVAPPKPAPAPAPNQKRPPGKKPLGTAPAGARKAPLPAEEPSSAPLQPKPTARPAVAKPGAPPTGLRGIKPPAAGLAGKRPAPITNSTSSPRRAAQSPTFDEASTPAPKISRGLTGRHLNKAPTAPTELVAMSAAPPSSGLSAYEKMELEDLRAEVERLRSTNESLRAEHLKLISQAHDLQDQNAQLIEDHTRDVLSIKAKETQLVRARSDAESAEGTVSQLQREVERLRRELGRVSRAESPRPQEYGSNSVFQESGIGMNNGNVADMAAQKQRHNMISPTPGGKENHAVGFSAGLAGCKLEGNHVLSPHSAGIPRPPSSFASPTRPPTYRSASSRTQDSANGQSLHGELPIRPAPDGFSGDGGRATPIEDDTRFGRSTASGIPAPVGGGYVGISREAGTAANGASVAARGGGGGATGQESWRRAAEVTQNLKARIELMKVSLA